MLVIEQLRAGRVRELDRVGAFVAGVCRNTLLDWRKGEQRRGALLDKFGPTMASVVEQPTSGVDLDRLEQCLQKLADRERMIVALTFYVERSADEIAATLAMNAGTVRVARHRALRQLHECVTGGLA